MIVLSLLFGVLLIIPIGGADMPTVISILNSYAGLSAVAMGFVGKISIHPSQIAVINEAFTPSKDALAEARELVAAFAEHAARGAYAFRFKGMMVDAPHLARARKLIERAGG